MSYSVSSTVTPLPEILYWSWTAGRPSTWPELLEWITAPALVKNWRLLDSRASDETGTNPLRAAAPTNPGGGLWPRATNWKPDAGGASVHWDGMLRLAPSPVGANVLGVMAAGAGAAAARSSDRSECEDVLSTIAAITAATTSAAAAPATALVLLDAMVISRGSTGPTLARSRAADIRARSSNSVMRRSRHF